MFFPIVLNRPPPSPLTFLLSSGLVTGSSAGTAAGTALVPHAVKLGVSGGSALLPPAALATGTLVGLVIIAGSHLGKRLFDRLPERVFRLLVEAAPVVSGLQFLRPVDPHS
jgi:uncharacterized membrane protein YfcA